MNARLFRPPADIGGSCGAGRCGVLERRLDVRARKPMAKKGGDEGVARAGGVERTELRRRIKRLRVIERLSV
jgi:hypothetical protein